MWHIFKNLFVVGLMAISTKILALPPGGEDDEDPFEFDHEIDRTNSGNELEDLTIPELIESALFGGPGEDEGNNMLEFDLAVTENKHQDLKKWLKDKGISNFTAFKKAWAKQTTLPPLDDDTSLRIEVFYMAVEHVQPLNQFSLSTAIEAVAESTKVDEKADAKFRDQILGRLSQERSNAPPIQCSSELKEVGKPKKKPNASTPDSPTKKPKK